MCAYNSRIQEVEDCKFKASPDFMANGADPEGSIGLAQGPRPARQLCRSYFRLRAA